MPHLDSGASLRACETALRSLMAHVYAGDHGSDWLTTVAGAEKLAVWAGRAEEEAKSRGRRGALGMPAAGLAYANLFDLITIAKKHWEPLKPALHVKGEVMPLLERLEKLRNAVGHSRPLVPYEEDLLAGIAGPDQEPGDYIHERTGRGWRHLPTDRVDYRLLRPPH